MPVKIVELPELGTIKLYKRRGAKAIKISITNSGFLRVSMPPWVPYIAGIEFAKKKKDWVLKHKKHAIEFYDGMAIGKQHHLQIRYTDNAPKPSTRVNNDLIIIKLRKSDDLSDSAITELITKACERALSKESSDILPNRLNDLAVKHGFTYEGVKVKKLRSRWGSCNQHKSITLNIYLMQLPWEFIDYVILHELTHTKYLHHGEEFWNHLDRCLPESKHLKKSIRKLQPSF